MTFSAEVILAALVQVALGGSAWGHIVANQKANRQRSDERHADNVRVQDETRAIVSAIDSKVDILNGTVREHGVEIQHLKRGRR